MTVLDDLIKDIPLIECPENMSISDIVMIMFKDPSHAVYKTRHVTYPKSTISHEFAHWNNVADIVGDFKSNVDFTVVINKEDCKNVTRFLQLCSMHSSKLLRFVTNENTPDEITLSWKEYFYPQDVRSSIINVHMNGPTNVTDGPITYMYGIASYQSPA